MHRRVRTDVRVVLVFVCAEGDMHVREGGSSGRRNKSRRCCKRVEQLVVVVESVLLLANQTHRGQRSLKYMWQ